MPDFVEDIAAAGAESRWWRRLGRSFISADSYGLVLLLVVVTYAVSVSVTQAWAGSIRNGMRQELAAQTALFSSPEYLRRKAAREMGRDAAR